MRPEAQIALSVATILFSGVISAAVAFSLRAEWEDRAVLRQKLEATHDAFHRAARDMMGGWVRSFDSNTSREAAAGGSSAFASMDTLIALYFPELKPFRDRLRQIRKDSVDPHATALIASSKGEDVTEENVMLFAGLTGRVTALKEEFDEEVRSVAHSIRPGGFPWRR